MSTKGIRNYALADWQKHPSHAADLVNQKEQPKTNTPAGPFVIPAVAIRPVSR
jgi:hypothetical protein